MDKPLTVEAVTTILQNMIESHIATSHKTPIIGCGTSGNMSGGPETLNITCRNSEGVEQRFKLTLEETTEGGKVREEAAAAAG